MSAHDAKRNAELKKDALLAGARFLGAVGVLFFIPIPAEVRPWIWFATKTALVALTALNLAYNVWRWRTYRR